MNLNNLYKNSVFSVVVGLLVLFALPLHATDNPLHKTVNGVEIYLGILPTEMVRGHPKYHPEGMMHGGIPAGTHYHVMVALFDAKTGARINNASVTATVKGLAAAERTKELESMLVAGARTYGNYFQMAGYSKQNRIVLEIRREGVDKLIRTIFEWTRS